MPQSLAQIYLHVIFSTKNRVPFLKDQKIRKDVHAYLAGACKNLQCPALRIGGVEDHVHIACRFSRTLTLAEFLRDLKKESSKWIKGKDRSLRGFHWQDGYAAFSVSPSHLQALIGYIERQEEHHRKVTFKDELRLLFKKYSVEYDERYVWD